MIGKIGKPLALTERSERPLLGALFVINLLGSLLETGGVGMVYLFLKIAMEPATFGGFEWVQDVYDWLAIQDRNLFLLSLTFVVMFVFIVRVGVQIFSAWLSLWVRKKMQVRVSDLLFNGYVAAPYSRHLKTKSSLLMNNVTTNSAAAIAQCTLGLVEIASATALAVLFLATLFSVRPLETLIAIVALSLLSTGYWLLMHERLACWGKRMIYAVEHVYAAVSEVSQGIKTIKMTGAEHKFGHRFHELIEEQTMLVLKNGLIQHIPRLTLELIVVIGIFSVLGSVFAVGLTLQAVIPTLALFGIAALRMVPAVVRIIAALQLYRNSEPCLEAILPDYLEFYNRTNFLKDSVPEKEGRSFKKSLALKNVVFHYEGAEIPAIKGVSLEVKRGEMVGFAGHSGSGKSTTVDIILGLLAPISGEVLLDGRPRPNRATLTLGQFAYLPQEPFIIDDTVRRNVAFGAEDSDIDEGVIWESLEGAALANVIKNLPQGIDTILGERGSLLSGGEKQRLGIARALYQNASVLVLDEPTAALDAQTEHEVGEVIKALRGKKTIIIIAHRLSSIAHCDKIIFFDKGRILGEGTFANLIQEVPAFKEMVDHLRFKETPASLPRDKTVNQLENLNVADA